MRLQTKDHALFANKCAEIGADCQNPAGTETSSAASKPLNTN
jgi:hypothetical protein